MSDDLGGGGPGAPSGHASRRASQVSNRTQYQYKSNKLKMHAYICLNIMQNRS